MKQDIWIKNHSNSVNRDTYINQNDPRYVRTEWTDGFQSWWFNSGNGLVRHREDGPAIIDVDGSTKWYINGKRVECQSQKEFEQMMRMKAFW
jgi:hypothetical protein